MRQHRSSTRSDDTSPQARQRRAALKGGSAAIGAGDTIGSSDCWCGKESGHDWVGKDAGAPHPR